MKQLDEAYTLYHYMKINHKKLCLNNICFYQNTYQLLVFCIGGPFSYNFVLDYKGKNRRYCLASPNTHFKGRRMNHTLPTL